MNIYLISQNKENGYNTYDSAVVVAETAKKAKETHPDPHKVDPWNKENRGYMSLCWAKRPEYVKSELIGKAKTNVDAGVVCSSFNAG